MSANNEHITNMKNNELAAWHKGKPTKQGIVWNEEKTMKIGYGNQAAERVKKWAEKHGWNCTTDHNANGNFGMYARTDSVATRVETAIYCR